LQFQLLRVRSFVYLQGKETHGSQSHPRVEAVKVWDWSGVALGVSSEVVAVVNGYKTDGNTGCSQQVKHGVQQFAPNTTTTTA
jgi:hypothetical protein